MKLRYLRIAFSVAWSAVGVVAIVLWIHSYFARLTFEKYVANGALLIQSLGGEVMVRHCMFCNPPAGWEVRMDTTPPLVPIWQSLKMGEGEFPGTDLGLKFRWKRTGSFFTAATFPHGFAILFAAALAALPWAPWRWRFSLRTLLIAMTLVAVALGVIVAL